MHIAIAGNIGAGKTTLTNLLSKHYGWETHYEDVDQIRGFDITIVTTGKNKDESKALLAEFGFPFND